MEDYYQRINYEILGAIKRKAINKYALISDNFWMIPVRFTTVRTSKATNIVGTTVYPKYPREKLRVTTLTTGREDAVDASFSLL